jgi:gamma-carbonic anhydrase
MIRALDMLQPEIGEGVFVADNAVVIGDVRLGRETSVWFGAVLRGDVGRVAIGDRVLIGMGAIILDGATVGAGSIIGAGALVPPGCSIPPGSLALGLPAKVKRQVTPEELEEIAASAARYVQLAARYRRATL